MRYKLKLRKVGNSLGVTFPKKLLLDISVREEGELFALQTLQGFLLVPFSRALEQGLEAFLEGKEKYSEALLEIAQEV